MSAQFHSAQPTIGADGVKTYINRDGDTVQESSGPVPIFRGLAAAGGEAFVSDSESEEEYHHDHAAHYVIPQHGVPSSEKKSKKDKKEKKSKKSKKERSGSSSSGHACTCGHSHH